jgi:hypothetical protein
VADETPQLSAETLVLFKEMLDQVQLPASHPDFDGAAARISRARHELDAALRAAAADGEPESS